MAQINKPNLHFNTKLYTGDMTDGDGTGHTQAITGVGFAPDWVWHKCRSHAQTHLIVDKVRGVGSYNFLQSSAQSAQSTSNSNGAISALGSDGFTLENGSDSGRKGNNAGANGRTYATWNWKANGAGSANTAGTINSTVSVNTTAGFSIVKYSGTGSNATVGHGLGAVPKVVLVKNLGQSTDWYMYTEVIGNTKSILLNSNNGQTSAYSDNWNNTSPTTTTFSVGTSGAVNSSIADHVAYCFAEKKGFSKFSSYVGNSSANGTFVYTGFRPAFIMAKAYTRSENWHMFDSKRIGRNVNNEQLYADSNSSEGDTDYLDILSNGFKFRYNSVGLNGAGESYLYWAFAENPIVGTNNIPGVAR